MSAQHGSHGPNARPVANTQNQWGLPAGQTTQQPAQHPQGGFAPSGGYGAPASPYGAAASPYGQGGDYGYSPYGAGAQPQQPQYSPQFEPYTPQPVAARPQAAQAPAPSYQHQPQHQQQPAPTYAPQGGYGTAPTYAPTANAGWPQPQAHGGGFDLGTYMPNGQSLGTPEPSQNDWNQGAYQAAQAAHGYQHGYQGESDGYAQQAPADQSMGYAQPQGGEIEQGYDEEAQEYDDAPARGRFPMKIAAVLAGAIVVGGGLMYGYKNVLGHGPGGEPPVVKSAAAPSKVKPEDGGGKQFAHADSKIMGRLGDGSGANAEAASSEADANGARKVSTLVVRPDGSIQAPAEAPAAEAAPAAATVSVPGMTVVDGLGASRAPAAAATMAAVNAPAKPQKPVTIAKAEPAPAPAQTASIEASPETAPAVPAAPAKPKKVKAAVAPAPVAVPAAGAPADPAPAAAPAPAPAVSKSVATTGNGASGFVAVLASVPRTDSSRMDALKRFADMQQKYGGVLQGKTPDVAEANLGAKGAYHRLVVGPPGSREQAASLCTQLKSQGYADCWVTAY